MFRLLLDLLRQEGGWSRVWVGLGMAITMAGGGFIYYQVQDGGAPEGTANFWIDANGGSCTRHSPAVDYAGDGSECNNPNAAYAAAACGDIVRITADGSPYFFGGTDPTAPQFWIDQDATISACGTGNGVTIEPAIGQTVTLSLPMIGHYQGEGNGCSLDGPDHLYLKNFKLKYGVMIYGNNDDVVLDGLDGGSFGVKTCGGTQTIQNSDWGPCSFGSPNGTTYQGELATCRNGQAPEDNSQGNPHIYSVLGSLLIKNNTFHGMFIYPSSGAHGECLQLNNGETTLSVQDVTIDANVWHDCQTNAISAGFNPGAVGGDIIIENNWFGCHYVGCSTPQMLNITSNPMDADFYVLNNSFVAGAYFSCEGGCGGGSGSGTNYIARGNIFGIDDSVACTVGNACLAGCIPGWTYSYNVYRNSGSGVGCGTNKTEVATLPYVDDPQDPLVAPDLHLTGTNVTGIDNVSGLTCIAHDYDDDARPLNTDCDAGSDERNQ